MNGHTYIRFRDLTLLIVITLCTLFAGLGLRDLWNPVEPRYAAVAAEILESGEWLVPSYDGELYAQKPAPFFWASAWFMSLTDDPGRRLMMVRMPSALGGLLMVIATWWIGRRFGGDCVGLWAGIFIAVSWLPFWSSRFCHMDTLTAAALAFAMYWLHAAAETLGRARRLRILAAGLALGAGLLLKGPSTLVFAAVSMLLLSLGRRDAGMWRRSGLLPAAGLSILIGAAWFIPAWYTAGDAWAKELAVDAGILHAFDSSNARKHTAFYYPSIIWAVCSNCSASSAACSRSGFSVAKAKKARLHSPIFCNSSIVSSNVSSVGSIRPISATAQTSFARMYSNA